MAHSRFRRAFAWRYRRFIQRQGYVVVTILCAAIIAGSAAWTQQAGFTRLSPAPTEDAASAADLWQQSLREAATPTPVPTEPLVLWHAPIAEMTVLQVFDAQRLVPTGIAGLWQVHDAVDFAAPPGEAIAAMRDGTVLEVNNRGLHGASVLVDHGDGFVAEYAGLSATAELQPGQRLKFGDILGHVDGSGLRLRVTQNGEAIDPLSLLAPPQP